MNDFDEFARQFRARTAARLLEFEKELAKAQSEVEKAAKAQQKRPTQVHRRAESTPQTPVVHQRRSTQVKGILRRESRY